MQKFVVELGQQISQLQQHKEKQEAVIKQLQGEHWGTAVTPGHCGPSPTPPLPGTTLPIPDPVHGSP